jgi:hypothetical protein
MKESMPRLNLDWAQFATVFQVTKELSGFCRNQPEWLARLGMAPEMAKLLIGILRIVLEPGSSAGVTIVTVDDPVSGYSDASPGGYVTMPGLLGLSNTRAEIRVPAAVASVWQKSLRFIMDSWGSDYIGRNELYARSGYELKELNSAIDALSPLTH